MRDYIQKKIRIGVALERIFHSIDIKKRLENELIETDKSLKIISAFCKLDALKFIDSILVNKNIPKKLLVRARLKDILSGVTDIEIYNYCINNNWDIYLNLELHSKIYVFNDTRIIIGSANLTSSGIGLNKKQNIESMACLDITSEEMCNIDKLFISSIAFTKNIYDLMRKQLISIDFNDLHKNVTWNKNILNLLEIKIHYLWTTEMLFSSSPLNMDKHDKALLDISDTDSLNDIKRKFKFSKAYLWLKTNSTSEIYFGELTAKLHNSLLDDPKPYRKDIKELLSNLLKWIGELKIEEVVIDSPNHSQRIRIIEII
ncbi:phospholipase D-like domain-containing protein [Clostridium botulinum]|uniref:phospholipase D-like domain-containing protein n=1 Tax=Clostridium botulinum TaxID=1491 RepID=UPI000774DE95|nr:phospholipase D-like domain-containing protein [Clostridium botulinum]